MNTQTQTPTPPLQRIVSTLPPAEKKRAEKLAKARDTSLSGLVRELIIEETKRVRGLKAQSKTNGKSNGAKAKASGTKARAKPKAAPKKTARRKPAPTQL